MRYVSCDVETFLIKPGVLAPRLVCMSVAEEGQPTALYDAVTACLVFRRLLRDPDVTIVGHNVAYDMLVLTLSADTMADTFTAYDANRITDTKIRQELLDIAAGRTAGTGGYNMVFRGGQYVKAGYSLADLEKLHLGIDRSAEKHNEDAWRFKYASLIDIPVHHWPAEAVQYAKADADNTLRVYQAQGARVPDEEEQVRAAWALHLTAWRGMRVDPERVAALDERMQGLRQANRRRLIQAGLLKPKKLMPAQIRDGKKPDFEEGGKPYVYSKDMARIKEYTQRVYRRQALPVPMTDKGAVCTDKDSLVESGSRLLATLAEGGGADKIINTYLPALKTGLVAPINTHYNVLVNSGRCSAARPSLQNVPSGRRVGGVRECFVPEQGNALISVDYDTLELRALAQCCLWLFGESRMAQAINSGKDLHLEVAAQLLKCSYEEALEKHKKKDKEVKKARDIAKSATFGFPGGLGADSFVMFARKTYGVKLTIEEAKKLKKLWLKAWPEMKPYFDYISRMTENEDNKLKQLGTERVRGRLRFTEAANTLFQGLAGSGAKRALYEVCRRAYARDLPGLYPVAFIHDEILAEAPVDKVHEYGYALADTMISAMQKYVPDVKITASPVAMNCWSKAAYEKLDENKRLQVWRYDEDKKSD